MSEISFTVPTLGKSFASSQKCSPGIRTTGHGSSVETLPVIL